MNRETKVKYISYAILMTLNNLKSGKIVSVAVVKLVTLSTIIWWQEHVSCVLNVSLSVCVCVCFFNSRFNLNLKRFLYNWT